MTDGGPAEGGALSLPPAAAHRRHASGVPGRVPGLVTGLIDERVTGRRVGEPGDVDAGAAGEGEEGFVGAEDVEGFEGAEEEDAPFVGWRESGCVGACSDACDC